jgi:hypothetical protein
MENAQIKKRHAKLALRAVLMIHVKTQTQVLADIALESVSVMVLAKQMILLKPDIAR